MARKYNRLRRSPRRNTSVFKKFFFLLFTVLFGGLVYAGYILFETAPPQVDLNQPIKYLGTNSEITITASDEKSGLQSVQVTLRQDDKNTVLLSRTFPRQTWIPPGGQTTLTETIPVNTKRSGLQDGKAELIISVRDFSLMNILRGNKAELRLPVTIDTKPPTVIMTHTQHYLRPGRSGIVTYTLSEPSSLHGVMLDNHFFRGFPLAKSKNSYVAYLGLPWNSKGVDSSRIIARDEAGNEASVNFRSTFKPIAEKRDNIRLSDGFLRSKLPEMEQMTPEIQGTDLDIFLYINSQVRKQNNETISALCAAPDPQRYWQDRFLRMAGANRAGYADQRTYYYNGQRVDEQTHLGVDIADHKASSVEAANTGKVIYADYLGIYGNMILLDHGQGVFSLYSHLSSMDVAVGDQVTKGQHIARSGATGMAGGDHLHFSMLIHGIFVDPVEWWDQHWLAINILDAVEGK